MLINEGMILVKKYVKSKCGSTLILLVITIAITAVLGASLLIVTMMNFKIKKANTEIRQSFYMSESGLNIAYIDAYKLVSDSIYDSMEKAQDYLQLYPSNDEEAKNIFINNYKLFITGQINNRITKTSNPFVKITNVGTLLFIIDELTVCIHSKYINESNIVKTTSVNLIIQVPDYNYIITNLIDISTLISLENWGVS